MHLVNLEKQKIIAKKRKERVAPFMLLEIAGNSHQYFFVNPLPVFLLLINIPLKLINFPHLFPSLRARILLYSF